MRVRDTLTRASLRTTWSSARALRPGKSRGLTAPRRLNPETPEPISRSQRKAWKEACRKGRAIPACSPLLTRVPSITSRDSKVTAVDNEVHVSTEPRPRPEAEAAQVSGFRSQTHKCRRHSAMAAGVTVLGGREGRARCHPWTLLPPPRSCRFLRQAALGDTSWVSQFHSTLTLSRVSADPAGRGPGP